MKNIKFYVSYYDVMGLFAKNAVNQSPYPRPDNLEVVLDKVSDILKNFFGDIVCQSKEMTYDDMKKFFMEDIIEQIPECIAWNNRKNGREGIGYCSRYDIPDPDDDFISLDALVRNITNDIVFSQYNGDSIPDILKGKSGKRGVIDEK